MKKTAILLLTIALSILFLATVWAQASPALSPLSTPSSPLPQALITSRTSDSGLLNTSHQMVLGPQSCTSLGDPYSPFNSTFRPPNYPPGPYTYQFRILIPSSYPDDVLRVELFDPDSSNAATNNYTVMRTSYAVANGLPATASKNCPGNDRMQPCIIDTDEDTLINPPNVTLDDVNPFWFGRVDENRTPTPQCDANGGYNENNNTNTVYQLWYYKQNPDGTIQDIHLAAYTGRKDNIAPHDTDLYWVSPGGTANFDHGFVPVDAGSPQTFELNLTADLPDIVVEPETGNRYVYLDVTAIDGSSENGFDIWAGPDDYIHSVPSQVNERNVAVLNNPGSHDAGGVVILAEGHLPQNVNGLTQLVERPLAFFGPEYAGRRLHLTLFDADSGTQAPIVFTFDTIDSSDWSLTFGVPNTIDPDGVPANSRCFPNCNNQFITPSYAITIPVGIDCTPSGCTTPFPGGYLLMNFYSGLHDSFLISMEIEPVNSLDVSGPINWTLGAATDPLFLAEAQFISPTLPITYTWHASEQIPISHTSGITDTAVFHWHTPGPKTITVIATDGFSTVTATHLITLYQPLLGLSLSGAITGLVGIDYDFTAVAQPPTATLPITYTWQASEQTPLTHTSGLTDVVAFSWPITGTQTVTVTAVNSTGEALTAVHTLTNVAYPIVTNGWVLHLPFIRR